MERDGPACVISVRWSTLFVRSRAIGRRRDGPLCWKMEKGNLPRDSGKKSYRSAIDLLGKPLSPLSAACVSVPDCTRTMTDLNRIVKTPQKCFLVTA
eukprot:1294648-Prymnesium_polylepis.1